MIPRPGAYGMQPIDVLLSPFLFSPLSKSNEENALSKDKFFFLSHSHPTVPDILP